MRICEILSPFVDPVECKLLYVVFVFGSHQSPWLCDWCGVDWFSTVRLRDFIAVWRAVCTQPAASVSTGWGLV